MEEVRCRTCQRVLSDAASVARQQGPQCAGIARTRCGKDVSDLQLALVWDAFDYASTPFEQWPWVRAHREAHANDPRRDHDCEGCQTYGLCAWHATSPELVALWRSFGVGKKRAVPIDEVVTEAR